jgi:hypothetical protein
VKAPSAALDLIARLEGEWVALDEKGKPTDLVVSVFEPTAGGSAIVEKLFPGADEEMLSIYSVDDGALVLAHYCVMGNQPRYAAEVEDGGKRITWRCQGGGNLKDHDRAHMHEGKVTFVGPDRMDTEWTALAAGKTVEHVVFQLQRKNPKK